MFSTIGRAAIRRIGGAGPAGRAEKQVQRVAGSQGGSNDIPGRALPILLSGTRFYSAPASTTTKPKAATKATKDSTDPKTEKLVVKKVLTEKEKKVAAEAKIKARAQKQKEKEAVGAARTKVRAQKLKEKEAADAARTKVRAQKQKEQKAVDDVKTKMRDLKAKVLTPPKQLPSTAWLVLHAECWKSKPGNNLVDTMKEVSTRYQTMDASTRELYNHQANQNKAANDASYKSWLSALTPQQIVESNYAQQRLKSLGAIHPRKHLKIDDPRIPKRPSSAFMHFYKEKYDSGDMVGIKATEAAKIASNEYNSLSPAEKKPYADLSAAQSQAYSKAMINAFGTADPLASVRTGSMHTGA